MMDRRTHLHKDLKVIYFEVMESLKKDLILCKIDMNLLEFWLELLVINHKSYELCMISVTQVST